MLLRSPRAAKPQEASLLGLWPREVKVPSQSRPASCFATIVFLRLAVSPLTRPPPTAKQPPLPLVVQVAVFPLSVTPVSVAVPSLARPPLEAVHGRLAGPSGHLEHLDEPHPRRPPTPLTIAV